MVKTFQAYLGPECQRTYSCVHCQAHLAKHDDLISKSFQGSQGRAYLFDSVVNIGCGPAEERLLLTGMHAVSDIYCECCRTTLGWKYVLEIHSYVWPGGRHSKAKAITSVLRMMLEFQGLKL